MKLRAIVVLRGGRNILDLGWSLSRLIGLEEIRSLIGGVGRGRCLTLLLMVGSGFSCYLVIRDGEIVFGWIVGGYGIMI